MVETELDPRALLRAESMVESVQQVFNEELVVARDVMTQQTDSDTITYWIQENSQADGQKRTPGAWDLDVDEWPEVSIEELDRDSKTLDGLAAKIRFSAKFLEFGTGNIDVAEGVDQMMRGFAEKFEQLAFDQYTNEQETSNGGEFTSYLHFVDSAGYANTNGHVVFNISSGNEWNNGGDAIDQLSDIVNILNNQGRLANLQGEVNTSDNWRCYIDGLTWNDLHKQLRMQNITPGDGEVPRSMTIPGIYGIEFVQANFAIQTNGRALMVDLGRNPMVGYYHIYDRLNDVGFTTVENDMAFPLQIKDKDEESGSVVTFAASGSAFVLRKPKYVALIDGLHA